MAQRLHDVEQPGLPAPLLRRPDDQPGGVGPCDLRVGSGDPEGDRVCGLFQYFYFKKEIYPYEDEPEEPVPFDLDAVNRRLVALECDE
jgi:hypothetical protein